MPRPVFSMFVMRVIHNYTSDVKLIFVKASVQIHIILILKWVGNSIHIFKLNLSFGVVPIRYMQIQSQLVQNNYTTVTFFQFEYNATVTQIKRLQYESVKVKQRVTLHCQNTIAYKDTDKSTNRAVQLLTFDDKKLGAEGPKKFRYGVNKDGCSVSNVFSKVYLYAAFHIVHTTVIAHRLVCSNVKNHPCIVNKVGAMFFFGAQ